MMALMSKRGMKLCVLGGWALFALSGCAGPQGNKAETQTYLLSAQFPSKLATAHGKQTLLVSPMRAHPGFDTPRMAYLREAHHLEYYAYHRWVESPARMLTPLLTQALESSGRFRAVAQVPGAVQAQLRVDSELVRLVQDFQQKPNSMTIQIRLQLVDMQQGAIVASRQFVSEVKSAGENAPAGVAAVNQALPTMLEQMAQWVAQASGQ